MYPDMSLLSIDPMNFFPSVHSGLQSATTPAGAMSVVNRDELIWDRKTMSFGKLKTETCKVCKGARSLICCFFLVYLLGLHVWGSRISVILARKCSTSAARVCRFATARQRLLPSVHRIRTPCDANFATMDGASGTSKKTMFVCAGSTFNPKVFSPVANRAAFS